ncbi:hypothetical protein ACWGI9_32670 [Streptomyces sp. NPDC054833]
MNSSGEYFAPGSAFLRRVGRLLGQAFLHRSREPLAQAPIDHVTAAEGAARQQQLDARTAAGKLENGVVDGRSPWACRGEAEPVQDDVGLAS